MSTSLSRVELDAYAQAQVDSAERVIADHQPDGIGCCTACGRVTPCDDVRTAMRQLFTYRTLADKAGLP